MLNGNLNERSLAASLQKQDESDGAVEAGSFCSQLADCGLFPDESAGEQVCHLMDVDMSQALTRGDACNLIYSTLKRAKEV